VPCAGRGTAYDVGPSRIFVTTTVTTVTEFRNALPPSSRIAGGLIVLLDRKGAIWLARSIEIIPQARRSFDLTAYATATGHLGRTLKLLGLKRQPRDETP
jgi:hypothetical protein